MSEAKITHRVHPKVSLIGIAIGVGITLVVGLASFGLWRVFQNRGVSFNFEGPNSVEAGSVNEYTLHLENQTRLSIKNAYISIDLPEGVKWSEKPDVSKVGLDLGEVEKGGIFDKTIELLIVGEPRSAKELKAVLRYQASGITSPFQITDNIPVILRDSLFVIEGDIPQKVLDGQAVPISLRWENRSPQAMEKVSLEVIWPENFVLAESNPRPTTGSNSWDIG
ncbi:MAG: hypothetical protein NTX26_03360, partial [Candidatus Parcubacteria bacterium]|nr:hypothetical protein [Candidatus Parcubacteria bacterium]